MRTYVFSLLLFAAGIGIAQPGTTPKPKLVIGLVVDQMRWDFLYRFESKYGNDGFRKLVAEGYVCEYAQYNYVPTYTAPGHASIYTGSVPAVHGIIGNDWYDKASKAEIYCVTDTNFASVGTTSDEGRKSPHRMITTTWCDELKISNAGHSKVIGLAIKDRSAILPAGHSANAAYWFDGKSGKWITSSYYRKDLPAWLEKENERITQEKQAAANWKTLLALDAYAESTHDDAAWEYPYKNELKPVFPHELQAMLEKNADVLKSVPYGNTMTLNAARAAIEGEQLGRGQYPDILCLSLSTPDMVGHQFGPNAVEIEDLYLRLDQEMASFISWLDSKLGRDNFVLFLTADHGGANNASFLKSYDIPAGNVISKTFAQQVDEFLADEFDGRKLIAAITNQQVFIDHDSLDNDADEIAELKESLSAFLKTLPGVAAVVDLEELSETTMPSKYKTMIENSYHAQRSGDLYIVLEPAWMEDFVKGTTHGTQYAYDTHVPLIFFGGAVKAGKDYSAVNITDIAPTISQMLKIQEPNGCIGKPITGVLNGSGKE